MKTDTTASTTTTAATESTSEDSPEALKQMFSDVLSGGDDSSAVTETTKVDDKPAPISEKKDAPASTDQSETHQPQADEKDRVIERLTKQLDGVLPRYEALQKEQRDRAAREKTTSREASKPVLTDEQKAQVKEFGELGDLVLSLSDQLSALQKDRDALLAKTEGFDEIRTEVEERKARDAKTAEEAETAKQNAKLADLHPDWKEVTNSPGMKDYLAKLPEEERKEFLETDNPRVYGSYLSDYKDTLKGATVTDIQSKRKERLKNVTTPTGRSSVPQGDDTNELEAIFSKVLKESLPSGR